MRSIHYLILVVVLLAFAAQAAAQFAPRGISPIRRGGADSPSAEEAAPPDDYYEKSEEGGGGYKSEDIFDELDDWDIADSTGVAVGDSEDDYSDLSLDIIAQYKAMEMIEDVVCEDEWEQEVADAKVRSLRKNLAAKLLRNMTVKQICDEDCEDKLELVREANAEYRQNLKDNQEYLEEYRQLQFQYFTSSGWKLFPSWSKYHTQTFFEGSGYDEESVKLFKNNLISISSKASAASAYNEIVYDYLGPLRMAVGTVLSMAEDDYYDDEEDDEYSDYTDNSLQRFLGGGGNIVLSAAYPMLYANLNNMNILSGDLIFYPKVSFDLPKIATDAEYGAINCDIGMEGSVYASGLLGNIAFYSRGRVAVMNGNRAFFDNLGAANKAHYYSQLSVGMAITSMFRLHYSWYFGFGDPYIRDNFTNMISFSIIPIDPY